MAQLVEYKLADGSSILVEANLPENGIERASRADKIVEATQSFEEVLDQVKLSAQAIISKLRSLADRPDELEVEFGIKLGAKAGVVISSTDVEANFKVTLVWKQSKVTTNNQ